MTRLAVALASALLVLALAAGHGVAQEPPVTRQVLPNGLTVLVRENGAVGVVAASLQVRAGSRIETDSNAGITNFLHRAMLRGTVKRSAVQLATSSEDIGGSLNANGEVETAELQGPIIEVLKTVYDPEIPVDIYELGLIYEIIVDADQRVLVKMTLTSPACPSAQQIPSEVRYKAKSVPGVADAWVEIVWEPPWDKDRMSEAAKLSLGFF